MTRTRDSSRGARWGRRAFSLAELLVVVGITSLLIAVLLPPLRAAHQQALDTKCAAQEQQLGIALESARSEYGVYPVWDDAGSPIRYTWIDVLLQRGSLGNERVGYCPSDPRPSSINSARGRHFGVLYPGVANQYGCDYSYGISVPLASAGWLWRPGFGESTAEQPRRLTDHERFTAQRVLAADSNWSTIYNLSGEAGLGRDWAYPTQFDNTIDWRHRGMSANLLYQDGHVNKVVYHGGANAIDTHRQFVWYAGESIFVNPADTYAGNFYPNAPPVNFATGESAGNFPAEMSPAYYTSNSLWTAITNK